MKKKIKDLTVKEFQKFCRKFDCYECPLCSLPPSPFCPVCNFSFFKTEEELEQELEREVEVDEKTY